VVAASPPEDVPPVARLRPPARCVRDEGVIQCAVTARVSVLIDVVTADAVCGVLVRAAGRLCVAGGSPLNILI
jgi:hypothetical protein